MRIDSHQHFWDISKIYYPWMPDEPSVLRRNYLPADLAPILESNRIDGCVTVQAAHTAEEAEFLLDLAERNAFIKGVVAWVDLTASSLPSRLDELQRRAQFRGVRHLVHDEPDDFWLLRDDVLRGLRELARRRLPYDLLVKPRHLAIVPQLADSVPDLRMVIDHIGKPFIAAGHLRGWAEDMERISQIPQIAVKLSGMITEADPKNWSAQHLQPYVQYVYQLFGPRRSMFGSDWPVCLLAGTWKQVLAAFTQALGPIPQADRDYVMGTTAIEFYGL